MSSGQFLRRVTPAVLEYGEENPDPPPHHHPGPWAVFQAFDPHRYTEEDRRRAASILRYLTVDPATPRSELLALGRRALSVVLSSRLLGHEPDEIELYLRIVRERAGRSTHDPDRE